MNRMIKSLALVGVLTVVWTASTPCVQAAGKLFLFAGQSNMVGIGDPSQISISTVGNALVFVAYPGSPPLSYNPPPFWLPPTGALTTYATWNFGGSWDMLDPGQYNYTGHFGPEFACVRDLRSGLGEQIYFAKYSVSGSSLDTHWNPANPDPGTPAQYTLSLYHSLVAWGNKALAAARANDPTTQIAGFFWMQGESDSNYLDVANRYQANLTSLIAHLRSDFGQSTLPVVIGRIANTAGLPYANVVRDAEDAVAAADPYARSVNTDGLEMDSTYHIHYTTPSLLVVGASFAQAWFSINAQPPTITCPANKTVSANAGLCYATGVALGTPTTSASCAGGVTVVSNAPAQFNKGVTTVTWTVTDACGKTATCAQTVTVNDTQAPTITCPANKMVSANAGCTATGVALGSPVTGDNCSVASVVNNAPTAFNKGVTTVTWTVTDGSGNTATCAQTVTVNDTQPPSITCPANKTVSANVGQCYATGVALGTPATSDNCGIQTVSNNAPAQFNTGVTTVTWTAVDTSGNTATCGQTVTVNDTQPPSITCPANVTVNTDSGQCYATGVALGAPVTGDNCGTPTVSNNAPAHFNKGVTTVTWTVADASGNTATCAQTVTVNDPQLPTITCPADVTVSSNNGCTATNVALGSPVTGDNCGVASVTSNAPAVYPLGTTVVTWTVTDGSGNTATCAQQVIVRDTLPPTITCPANVTVNADSGQCYATGVALGTPTTSDNCGIQTVSNNGPASYPVGATTVTWTAVDTSGNTASCSQTVTVVGGAACYTIADCTAINVVLGSVATGDDCSVASVTNDAPVVYPLGTNIVIWTVTDGSGNTATWTQWVIVRDRTPPTITCPANVTVAANAGSTAINVALGSPVTGDNCSVASVGNNAPAAYPLGANSVTWTVTDRSGNTATGVQIVTVVPSSSSPPGHPAISYQAGGGTITWDGGVLQQADDILGVYTDVPGATSPWPIAGSDPQKFYRVRGTGP